MKCFVCENEYDVNDVSMIFHTENGTKKVSRALYGNERLNLCPKCTRQVYVFQYLHGVMDRKLFIAEGLCLPYLPNEEVKDG